MTPEAVKQYIIAGQEIGDEILETIEGTVPGVAMEAALAETVLNLLARYVALGLSAWSNASGQPITEANVQALMPNATPLTSPDASGTAVKGA